MENEQLDIMRTSVSEIASFRECLRKWYFSGRNGLYLRPKEQATAFAMGSAFHDALEHMYGEKNYNILEIADKYKLTEDDAKTLKFQTNHYKDLVLKNDLEKMEIIAPEMSYNIQLTDDIVLFGFMDIVYKNKKTESIGVLEHKFVKNFRSDTFNLLDDQIKGYEMSIKEIFGNCDDGVNLNQVRKLKTKFDHSRDTYKLTDAQLDFFREEITGVTSSMKAIKDNGIYEMPASPNWMGCGFCEYRDLCLKLNAEATNDTTIITQEDIENAGLEYNGKKNERVEKSFD